MPFNINQFKARFGYKTDSMKSLEAIAKRREKEQIADEPHRQLARQQRMASRGIDDLNLVRSINDKYRAEEARQERERLKQYYKMGARLKRMNISFIGKRTVPGHYGPGDTVNPSVYSMRNQLNARYARMRKSLIRKGLLPDSTPYLGDTHKPGTAIQPGSIVRDIPEW